MSTWPNGDISVVTAQNKNEAIDKLDEIGNADYAEVTQLDDFLVNFSLTDEGTLILDETDQGGFGYDALEEIMRRHIPGSMSAGEN